MNVVMKQPHMVSLENFYPTSEHPDVATFQAALVKGLHAEIPITGVYDLETAYQVLRYHSQAREDGIALATLYPNSGTYVPNENFTRMVGLDIRK